MFASFEKDYIMRIVREMVRMLLKLLFNIDTSRDMQQVIKEAEEKQLLDRLIKMTDEGHINEAENELYEITLDGDRVHLKTALIFYYCLAMKGEAFLKDNNYTMQEVKEGVEALTERYGIEDIGFLFAEN